jgi:elongation factor G
MKDANIGEIRSFGLVGHQGCGKTTLAEAMLFLGGAIPKMGSVDSRSSVMDTEPEEQERGGSICAAFATTGWRGLRLHIADTPGDGSYHHEPASVLAGVDAAVAVVSAVDGVEVETEHTWKVAQRLGLPRVAFINKMDRERANPDKALSQMRDRLGARPVPMQVPIGREAGFRGVVDLLSREALIFRADGSGKSDKAPVPEDLADEVETAWLELMENAAEGDDELIEKYLESGELTKEEVVRGLHLGVQKGLLTPVVFGAAPACKGVDRLLDLIANLPAATARPPRRTTEDAEISPDPDGPLAAVVLKSLIDPYAGKISVLRIVRGRLGPVMEAYNTTRDQSERLGTPQWVLGRKLSPAKEAVVGDIVAVTKLKNTSTGDTLTASSARIQVAFPAFPPAMSTYVVRPASKADEDKVRSSLLRLAEEDPALRIGSDELTKEITVSGCGQAHVEMCVNRLRRKYGVQVELSLPPVPYRETIRGRGEVEGKHKKQTGGRGQFGVAWLRFDPQPRNAGFEFVDAIVGGAIPRNFIPAVEKGVRDAMERGVVAGYPVCDVKVTVFDGKYHPVDSSEAAFKIAGSKGFKAGFIKCDPVILEPIMKMTIVVPEDNQGDVMGDISGRRGRVQNTDYQGKTAVITALAPLAEVQTYAPSLRAMTQGKGSFTWELHGYEEVPAMLQDKIIAESTRKGSDEDEE